MKHNLMTWFLALALSFAVGASFFGEAEAQDEGAASLSGSGNFQIMLKGDGGFSPEVNFQNPASEKFVPTTSSSTDPFSCSKTGGTEVEIDTWDMPRGFEADWTSGTGVSFTIFAESDDDQCPDTDTDNHNFRFDLFHGDEIISQGSSGSTTLSGTQPTRVDFEGSDLSGPGFYQAEDKLKVTVFWQGSWDITIYYDKEEVSSGIVMDGDPLQVVEFDLSETETDLEMYYRNVFPTRQEATYVNMTIDGTQVEVTPRHSKDLERGLLKMVWTVDVAKGDKIIGEISYTTNTTVGQGMVFNTEFAGSSKEETGLSGALLWTVIGVSLLVGLAFVGFWIYIMIWTYRDANALGFNAVLWLALVFFGNFIAWLIYLFVIRKGAYEQPPGGYYQQVPAV